MARKNWKADAIRKARSRPSSSKTLTDFSLRAKAEQERQAVIADTLEFKREHLEWSDEQIGSLIKTAEGCSNFWPRPVLPKAAYAHVYENYGGCKYCKPRLST